MPSPLPKKRGDDVKIKALCCFVGTVCMNAGDVLDVSDDVANDLVQAGYAERAESTKAKRKADKNENK